MNFDISMFRKSKYIALEEYLLHLNALKAVHDFYVPPGVDYKNDYYLSPVKANYDIIKKMPPIRIFTCMLDPLRDD